MTTLSFTDRKGHSGLRSVWLDGRHTLIETAKLNGLDPQTWLTDKQTFGSESVTLEILVAERTAHVRPIATGTPILRQP
jgi:hypothetical protein